MQANTADLTFENLCYRFGTGRSYTISGSGKDRVVGYRSGVMCRLGDIEETEWFGLMKDLISRSEEGPLFSNLLCFISQQNYTKISKSELEHEALILHSMRIFDDEEWVDFIPFNERYRPQRLEKAHVRQVICDCCQKEGLTTQAIIERSQSTGTIPCPVCGRHSNYRLVSDPNLPISYLP